MSSPLAPLFQESAEEVRERERSALDTLLNQRQRRVVLFGAGTLGRRARAVLMEMDATVLAFSDNNAAVHGKQIEGLPVLSPEEAAERYGDSAVFLVTIWNEHHWFNETYAQLSRLGCTLVSTYAPLFWKFGNRFLQVLLLNGPPHRVYLADDDVLRTEGLWADNESLKNYRANIRWRALGDPRDLPGRPGENTYFPAGLFAPGIGDTVLDCGAFDGDTIRQLLSLTAVRSIDAVEADTISADRLRKYVASLAPGLRESIRIHPIAVGREGGFTRFESSGNTGSRTSERGPLVQVARIDDLFAERPLTFIKMDIEGAEYDALLGARKVIERDRPILAICVYHTQSDIWRIPLLVREMLPDYKFFLRGYEGDGFQTVMYAVPPERIVTGTNTETSSNQ